MLLKTDLHCMDRTALREERFFSIESPVSRHPTWATCLRSFPLLFCCLLGIAAFTGCNSHSSEYRPLTAADVNETETSAAEVTPATQVSKSTASMSEASMGSKEANPLFSGSSATPSFPVQSGMKNADETGNRNPRSSEMEGTPVSPASSASEKTVPKQPDRNEEKQGDATQNVAALAGTRESLLTKPAAQPLEIKLLVPQKEFMTEGADHAFRVTFDDLDLLKVCNMEPVPPDVMKYLPDWLKKLNGQKIILRGWMFPSGRQEGISSFMFVRDNGICCFGRDPKVYDKLAVTMQPGKTTRYIAGRPFDVEATFLIEPDIEGSEEGLWWLYRLENARVIDQ